MDAHAKRRLRPWCSMCQPAPGQPLRAAWHDALPVPGADQLRIEVACCGVCCTDLHLLDAAECSAQRKADGRHGGRRSWSPARRCESLASAAGAAKAKRRITRRCRLT